jgi:GMP synthase (glutamine-hydrolysing)
VRILTLTHGADVGPELFADVAAAAGDTLQIWDMQHDGPPPRAADAVAVFGGHQNVGEEDRYPWLHDEYAALREWACNGTPLFAVCLGAQTLAHALGAAVDPLEQPLAGFYSTRLTEAGCNDPVLGALPGEFACFNGNHYGFELPRDATLLATGPCLQAYRVGDRAWAVQFHPEVKRTAVLSWFDDTARAALAPGLESQLAAWRPLGTDLFQAFLEWARLDSNQGPRDYESPALTS